MQPLCFLSLMRAGRASGVGFRSPARPTIPGHRVAARAECLPFFHLRVTVQDCTRRSGQQVNPLRSFRDTLQIRRAAKLFSSPRHRIAGARKRTVPHRPMCFSQQRSFRS